MQGWSRTVGVILFRSQPGPVELRPNYPALMKEALRRVRMAELQIRESCSPEELEVGRSALLAAWAEVQQLIRTAKRERGLPLRPVAETEELHRKMRDFMNHRGEGFRKRAASAK